MKLEGIKKIALRRPRAKAIKGLTQDAATLGVSRYFLWQVLKGHATSAPLIARYNALKVKKNQPEKPTTKTT